MDHVTSFHAAAVPGDQLNGIIAEWIALEEARVFRRLLVTRFGLLALTALAAGVSHWLSALASSVSAGAFLVPPVWACVHEWRCRRGLARRLDHVPGALTREMNEDPAHP